MRPTEALPLVQPWFLLVETLASFLSLPSPLPESLKAGAPKARDSLATTSECCLPGAGKPVCFIAAGRIFVIFAAGARTLWLGKHFPIGVSSLILPTFSAHSQESNPHRDRAQGDSKEKQ